MNAEWPRKTLRECASWYSGGTPRKSNPDFWNGAIPWISAKSLTEFFIQDSDDKVSELGAKNGTRLMPAETILFIVRGMSLKTEFRMGITRCPVTFNQDLKALVSHEGILPLFLAYAIKSRTNEILGMVGEAGHGTGVLPTDRIERLEIPVPEIIQQKKIVHILKTIDDKIELNRQINQTLEEMAGAIFNSWFVNFEPVKAKIEAKQNGRNPERAAMCAISGKTDQELALLPADQLDQLRATVALFPDELIDSELGLIPKDWEVTTLGDHVQSVRGFSYKGAGLTDNGTPMHNLNSVYEGGGYKHEGIKFYSLDYKEKHTVKPGDVIVANTEQGFDHLLIGYGAMIPKCFDEGIFSHHLYRLRPQKNSPIDNYFILHLFLPGRFRKVVAGYTNGTTVNMLPADGLTKPKFALPHKKLIRAFARLVAPIYETHEINIQTNQSLSLLRDTLLPKLLSGEISVNGAESTIQEAV